MIDRNGSFSQFKRNKMHTEEQIQSAILNVRSLCLAPIVRYFSGFIIMAQTENDYKSKKRKIERGCRDGFYSVDRAIEFLSTNTGERR